MALLKWQINYLQRIREMSNEDLLLETWDQAGGDDYDGCFTTRGQWEYNEIRKELISRLKVSGFVNENFEI